MRRINSRNIQKSYCQALWQWTSKELCGTIVWIHATRGYAGTAQKNLRHFIKYYWRKIRKRKLKLHKAQNMIRNYSSFCYTNCWFLLVALFEDWPSAESETSWRTRARGSMIWAIYSDFFESTQSPMKKYLLLHSSETPQWFVCVSKILSENNFASWTS